MCMLAPTAHSFPFQSHYMESGNETNILLVSSHSLTVAGITCAYRCSAPVWYHGQHRPQLRTSTWCYVICSPGGRGNILHGLREQYLHEVMFPTLPSNSLHSPLALSFLLLSLPYTLPSHSSLPFLPFSPPFSLPILSPLSLYPLLSLSLLSPHSLPPLSLFSPFSLPPLPILTFPSPSSLPLLPLPFLPLFPLVSPSSPFLSPNFLLLYISPLTLSRTFSLSMEYCWSFQVSVPTNLCSRLFGRSHSTYPVQIQSRGCPINHNRRCTRSGCLVFSYR